MRREARRGGRKGVHLIKRHKNVICTVQLLLNLVSPFSCVSSSPFLPGLPSCACNTCPPTTGVVLLPLFMSPVSQALRSAALSQRRDKILWHREQQDARCFSLTPWAPRTAWRQYRRASVWHCPTPFTVLSWDSFEFGPHVLAPSGGFLIVMITSRV